MKDKIINTVYPQRCFVCMDFTKNEYNICHECLTKMEYINTPTCLKCGLPVFKCQCEKRYYHFKKFTAPFKNEGAMQKGIYNLKFNGFKSAAVFYGRAMAQIISIKFKKINFDYICPVPMGKIKKLCRGYNQSAILAENTAKFLNEINKTNAEKENKAFNKIIYNEDLLSKCKRTKTQHKVLYEERWTNLRNSYKVNPKYNLSGKTILLIDDIKTTGATLDECSRTLLLKGAKAVYCSAALVGY